MALFPEVQKKAQAELDALVGPDRLPDYSDYESLIYIRAVVLEAMRWMPVVPLGLPHRVTTDDEYEGYSIPKGTIIISVSMFLYISDSSYSQLLNCRTHGELIILTQRTLGHLFSGLCFMTQRTIPNPKSSIQTGSSKMGN